MTLNFYRLEKLKLGRVSEFLLQLLLQSGVPFSGPYGGSARMIINRDAATVAALEKVKAIVDPTNIMNEGKSYF